MNLRERDRGRDEVKNGIIRFIKIDIFIFFTHPYSVIKFYFLLCIHIQRHNYSHNLINVIWLLSSRFLPKGYLFQILPQCMLAFSAILFIKKHICFINKIKNIIVFTNDIIPFKTNNDHSFDNQNYKLYCLMLNYVDSHLQISNYLV